MERLLKLPVFSPLCIKGYKIRLWLQQCTQGCRIRRLVQRPRGISDIDTFSEISGAFIRFLFTALAFMWRSTSSESRESVYLSDPVTTKLNSCLSTPVNIGHLSHNKRIRAKWIWKFFLKVKGWQVPVEFDTQTIVFASGRRIVPTLT